MLVIIGLALLMRHAGKRFVGKVSHAWLTTQQAITSLCAGDLETTNNFAKADIHGLLYEKDSMEMVGHNNRAKSANVTTF